MTFEIIKNLSFDDYLKIDAVNHSSIKNMDICPLYYKRMLDASNASTGAMNTGTAVHSKMLEPDTYSSNTAVFEGARRAGKDWIAFKEANENKTIISKKEAVSVDIVCNSLSTNRDTERLFSNPDLQAELTLVWIDEKTGIKCKCRIDMYLNGYLYDLKTSSTKTPDEFIRNATKYFYHTQIAFYRRGLMACGMLCNDCMIVVGQTVEPFGSYLVDVPRETIDNGNDTIDEWLDSLKYSQDENNFNGFTDSYSFDLPAWMTMDDDNEITIDGEDIEV